MKVTVFSNIPGKTDVAGEYTVELGTSIVQLIQGLGLTWDLDALVVVNQAIVNHDYLLKDRDEIHLLIPILGG